MKIKMKGRSRVTCSEIHGYNQSILINNKPDKTSLTKQRIRLAEPKANKPFNSQ